MPTGPYTPPATPRSGGGPERGGGARRTVAVLAGIAALVVVRIGLGVVAAFVFVQQALARIEAIQANDADIVARILSHPDPLDETTAAFANVVAGCVAGLLTSLLARGTELSSTLIACAIGVFLVGGLLSPEVASSWIALCAAPGAVAVSFVTVRLRARA